ncbi:MAG: hypothetical protein ACLFQM_10290 [Fidelibacterota bacterium]
MKLFDYITKCDKRKSNRSDKMHLLLRLPACFCGQTLGASRLRNDE